MLAGGTDGLLGRLLGGVGGRRRYVPVSKSCSVRKRWSCNTHDGR